MPFQKKTHTHATPPLSLQAALLRSEKLYDELEKSSYSSTISSDSGPSSTIFREHVVSVRSASSAAFSDWVPVCQLGVLSSTSVPSLSDSAVMSSCLSYLAREVCHSSSLVSPPGVPRSDAEFGVEPLSDFLDHVYEAVVKPSSDSSAMSGAEARSALGVEADDSDEDVKKKYRKITLRCHPDRFVSDPDGDEARAGAREFDRAAKAYEVLSATSRAASYYEGLGGKGRSAFGAVRVEDVGKERTAMRMDVEVGGYRAAVRCLDPDVPSFFVARNGAR